MKPFLRCRSPGQHHVRHIKADAKAFFITKNVRQFPQFCRRRFAHIFIIYFQIPLSRQLSCHSGHGFQPVPIIFFAACKLRPQSCMKDHCPAAKLCCNLRRLLHPVLTVTADPAVPAEGNNIKKRSVHGIRLFRPSQLSVPGNPFPDRRLFVQQVRIKEIVIFKTKGMLLCQLCILFDSVNFRNNLNHDSSSSW